MNANIEKICGESELTPDFDAIASNPAFVFDPDLAYETLVLYNSDGLIINVNSWLECANYVNGGWFASINNLINYEKRLFFILLFFTTSYITIEIAQKLRGQKNSKK